MRGDGSALNRKGGGGELQLLERIRRRAARLPLNRGIQLGIGDDCALLSLKTGEEAAITTDLSIEKRHFRLELHPPEAIGHRTLARGLSDLAAMGARPVATFLSLGLPHELTVPANRKLAWIDRFFDGFLALAARFRVPLAGGDLSQSPLALADVVAVGAVPCGDALLRSGARPGDLIYVTGALGGSAAGLRAIRKRRGKTASPQKTQPMLAPHLWPEPRIPQGLWLRSHGAATAAIDISDGLSTDLEHLCAESGVSAEIDAQALPAFPGATSEEMLHGGEDYELLFTAPPAFKMPRRIANVPISRIGKILRNRTRHPGIVLVDASGTHLLKPQGWEHFRKVQERR